MTPSDLRPSTTAGLSVRRGVPEATVARLPLYLRALSTLTERGVGTVSSEELANAAGVTSAKVRKDLSHLGSYGTRGVGYDVAYLRHQISHEVGLSQEWGVVIIGVGHLGHALAGYGGFTSRGFRIVALVDSDPARTGDVVAGVQVEHSSDLAGVIARTGAAVGVIATPGAAAQQMCDELVGLGITSILNFAPYVVVAPAHVSIRQVDLAVELRILAFHEQRKAGLPADAVDVANGIDVLAEVVRA